MPGAALKQEAQLTYVNAIGDLRDCVTEERTATTTGASNKDHQRLALVSTSISYELKRSPVVHFAQF